MEGEELEAAQQFFPCTPSRMTIKAGDLVIPRYAFLPFAKELSDDIKSVGATLINSYHQHCYVADVRNWVYDLNDLTFLTWDRLEDLPENVRFRSERSCGVV